MEYLPQEITSFTYSNITETSSIWSASIVTAGTFVIGQAYTIVSIGTTDFTLIGAATNTVGLVFVATGVGAGTGTAQVTYQANNYVIYGTYIYKCVSQHVDKNPETFLGIYWIKFSISNKFAMLDLSAQSKSFVDNGNLVVEFLQNRMGTLAIGNYEADTLKVEILDTDSVTVLYTYNTLSSVNIDVVDYYSYIYSSYGYQVDRAIKIVLPIWGYKVRCTFIKSVNATRSACGFLVGGSTIPMGRTMYNVNFNYNSFAIKNTDDFGSLSIIKRAVQDKVDFETYIVNADLMRMRREIKKIYNDIVCFIVEDESDRYENLITLGTIESANVVLSNPVITTMTFSVIEAI